MVFESRKEFNDRVQLIAYRLNFGFCKIDEDFGFMRPFDEKYDSYIKIVYNGNKSVAASGGYSLGKYYTAEPFVKITEKKVLMKSYNTREFADYCTKLASFLEIFERELASDGNCLVARTLDY